jgi:hypothetical protein
MRPPHRATGTTWTTDTTPTGVCPDCLTHEAALCASCRTPVGCQQGTEGHACVTAAVSRPPFPRPRQQSRQ